MIRLKKTISFNYSEFSVYIKSRKKRFLIYSVYSPLFKYRGSIGQGGVRRPLDIANDWDGHKMKLLNIFKICLDWGHLAVWGSKWHVQVS